MSLLRLALAVGVASAAFAQQPTLLVHPPDRLYSADSQAEFWLGGRNLEDAYPDLVVYLDGADVTTQVGWTWSDEHRVDVNSDGWLESFRANVQLDLSALAMGHDSVLEVEATTDGALGAPVSFRAGERILGHVQVGLTPSRVDPASLPAELGVMLTNYGVPATGVTRTLRIVKDGVDVTGSAVYIERLLEPVVLPTGEVDWRSEVLITTSSLGTIDATTTIEVYQDITIPGSGAFTGGAAMSTGTGVGQLPCMSDEVCAFIQTMGITKAPTGELSVGVTDCAVARQAAEDLKQGLRNCQTASQKTEEDSYDTTIDCDGVLFDVVLVIGGNSATWAEPTIAGSDTVQNSLILAIGGDGTGADTGGATTEARAGKGSVAIAVGGTASGKSFGGRATATATEEDSTGIALGGTGGEAGGQGGGSFVDCENQAGGPGGQGLAAGGPGGHSGASSVGGHGGGAGVRSNMGDLSVRDGGPKESGAGGPGVHGSGACAQADAAGNASAQLGKSVEN